MSNAPTKLVSAVALNDAPVLTGNATPLGYTRGAAAILLSSTFGMSDPDSADFAGGGLLVKADSGAEEANPSAARSASAARR